MTDPMLNPQDVLKSIEEMSQFISDASHNITHSLKIDLSKPAAQSAVETNRHVQGIIDKVNGHFKSLGDKINDSRMAHQDGQQRKQPYDFKHTSPDLRSSPTQGAPAESWADFFKPFNPGK